MKKIDIELSVVSYYDNKLLATTLYDRNIKNIRKSISKLKKQFSESKSLAAELISVEDRAKDITISYWCVCNAEKIYNKKLADLKELKPSKKNLKLHEKLMHRLDHISPYHTETLLGKRFTINELFKLHSISNPSILKPNFHKLIDRIDILEPTGKRVTEVGHRPPELYRFKKGAVSSTRPQIIF